MRRIVSAAVLFLWCAMPTLAEQGKPEVNYFELRGDTLERVGRALDEFVLGDPRRFSWHLQERLELDYDFAFSAPRAEELDKLDRVTVGIVMDMRRCRVPLRMDLPAPQIAARLPETERGAWESRTQSLRAGQLLHQQVFRDARVAERACAEIGKITALEIPLIKRKPLGRDIVLVYLRDRVALILEHYDELLAPLHARLNALRDAGPVDKAAEAAFFATVRQESAVWPDFR